jgi:subtilisin family serine protease
MRIFLSLFLLSFCTTFLVGQQILDEVIVRAMSEETMNNIFPLYNQQIRTANAEVKNVVLLNEDLHLYKIEYTSPIDNKTLSNIKRQKGIISASFNEYVENRVRPNDVKYGEQWALEFSKVQKVWDITTGGKTYDGKEIVIAQLDDGMDINHEDLKDNIYVNTKEIPNDGKDNDGNGYVDDYKGYNLSSNNGNINSLSHGTSVAGIMGAMTNNSTGIAGINWKVKIMPIVGIDRLDRIISAYSYIISQRRRFNNTNGAQGAFIAVTNYSGGISNAFGNVEPYRAWCDLFDVMGNDGILSIGATTNESTNIDLLGDMPSTCLSEFFISTTNIDKTGEKVARAGFSQKYISLAAPGENLTTLKNNNGYQTDFSGTSGAAPMVAGVAALLFSVPCEPFSTLIVKDRVAAVRGVRNAIINGLTKTDNLKQLTKGGGYLNAEAAVSLMSGPCDGKLLLPSPKGDLGVLQARTLGSSVIVEYITPNEEALYSVMVSDEMGRIIINKKLEVPSFGNKLVRLDDPSLQGRRVFISVYTEKDIITKFFWLK